MPNGKVKVKGGLLENSNQQIDSDRLEELSNQLAHFSAMVKHPTK